MKKTLQEGHKKSKAMALASFILGLTFWIPLLNLFFGMLAIYTGIKALLKIRSQPLIHGGKAFAIIGISLGAIVYLFYLVGLGMCLIGYKEICRNIGLAFITQ